jgi:ABC-type bacteriocin/lantibiotic exporter with double-glycine peptidase domain
MSRANGAREAFRSLSTVMNDDESSHLETRPRLSRPRLSGAVELKGVAYSFPGSNSPIINNLSLKIPAGQKVAIVGNLQMGFYEYDDTHILNIAKVSGVDDFVSSHPQGYDLELKERGEGLSGGQRQSINLARALLHEPSLLILDEPTSSMDTGTEKGVIARLKQWSGDRTVIMVTHRNTLLELADRVLVIDQGQVVADTTPERLRAQGLKG